MPKTTGTTVAIDRGELLWVEPKSLSPNPWNPNRMDSFMFAKELESLRKFGMASPIVARETAGGYQIIDGEHRWKALAQLEIDPVPIWNVGWISDATAKQLSIVLNETRGSAERQKLSELLQDLLTSETTESLLQVLPFSKDSFAELANLPKFDWEEFEREIPKRTEDAWVERIYRLPVDAAKVLDDALALAKEGETLPDGIALERIAAAFLAS